MPNLIRVHPSAASCHEVENKRYGCPLFVAMATISKEATKIFLMSLIANQSPGRKPYKVNTNNFDEE